jgi:hypothetical protein
MSLNVPVKIVFGFRALWRVARKGQQRPSEPVANASPSLYCFFLLHIIIILLAAKF